MNETHLNSSDESSDDSSVASSTSDPGSAHALKDESTPLSLTHKETRAVNRSKILVYVALFVAAIGVGVSVYWISRRAEEHDCDVAVSQSFVDGLNYR